MKYEYLLYHFCVIIFPLLISFHPKAMYVKKWPLVFLSSLITALPYLIWDQLATGKHWSFNPDYNTGMYLFSLPIEEVLFFFTTPFSCLFLWEVIVAVSSPKYISSPAPWKWIRLGFLLFAALLFWKMGKHYMSLVLAVIVLSVLIDTLMKTRLYANKQTWIYLIFILLLIAICNGYLTARPIVTYHTEALIGYRLGTIPVEDFLYGIGHIMLTLITYTTLKRATHKQK